MKERGTGLGCCSRAMCSSQKGAVGPKAPRSPQLIAVILDDNLDSVVPQLSSEQQVLVFQIFHLAWKGGRGDSEQTSWRGQIPHRIHTSASEGKKMKAPLWKPEAGVPHWLTGHGVEEGWNEEGSDLLSKHIIVQLQLVKPLQFFRQPVVTLSKLLDIITGFGQNSTFTLQEKANEMRTKIGDTWLAFPKHTLWTSFSPKGKMW